VRKLYQVTTDRKVHPADLEKLLHGVTLSDGVVKADKASLVPTDRDYGRVIGVELHSGKNRVVRRMFETLGYKVQRLDRVMFAGLSKKQLSRGQWRFLTEKEVSYLKMLG
jgi:23S rRNA pseudouridine2605 synthase